MGLDMYLMIGEEVIADWRKFNALHSWFVENVQGGVDDCEAYPVTMQQLKDVLKVLKQVDEDKSKACFLLPTRSGFFFGSTNYDKYYFGDVNNSVQAISDIIQNYPSDTVFHYQSSW